MVMTLVKSFIRIFSVVMVVTVGAQAQVTPTPFAAFLGAGSPVTWSPWTSASGQGALQNTPPAIGLYCQANPPLGPWTPCVPGGGGGGTGTVTDVSSGNFPPLFNVSIANPTTTPALTFTASLAAQNSVLAGPATGGTGAYSFRALVAADIPLLPLPALAQIGANTMLGNWTGSTANVTANAMPSCSTSSSALIYTTSTGIGCNTAINAATANSATISTNIAGGALGSIPYQSGASVTAMLAGNATNGLYALTENVTGSAAVAPVWTTLGAAAKNGNYEGIAIFGDSMTVGFGSLLPNGSTGINYIGQNAPGWGPGLLGDFGSGQGLYGFSGDMAADMAVKQYFILLPQSDHNPAVAAGGGVNDNTVYGTNTNQQDTFTGTTLESMANATIPTAAKVFATQCTATGTWAAYALSGTTYPGVRTSSTNASTLTCTLITYSNGPIYLANLKSDNSGAGTASVTIDGSSVAGFTTQALGNSSIATQNGLHQAPYLNRYVGPYTAGTHTIVITVTSATGALAVIPMWVGAPCLLGAIPCANAVGTGPTYFASGVPPNSNNTPSGTGQYNTLVQNAVTLMAGDGLPVYFVDILNGTNTANSNTFAAINATTDYAGGTVGNATCITSPFLPLHINNCGHAKTRRAFEAAMNIQRSGQEVAPTHVGLTSNGFVLPFPGYNYQALNGYPVGGQLIGWGAKDAAAAGTADPNLYGEVSTGGAYIFQVNSASIGSAGSSGLIMTVPVQGTSVTSTTFSSSPHYFTATNCTSTASPAVCGSASVGQVQIAASATSITINTTAITANSRMGCLTYSTVGITAPTNIASLMQPSVSAITAGTSFTLTIPVAPLTNAVNLNYCFFN